MSSGSSSFITPPHQQGKAIAALAEKLLLMHPEPPKKAEAPEGGVKTDYLGVRRDPEETVSLRKGTTPKDKEHDVPVAGGPKAVIHPTGKAKMQTPPPKPEAFINADPVLRAIVDDIRYAATDISRRQADQFDIHLVAQLFSAVVDYARTTHHSNPAFRDELIGLMCDVFSSNLYTAHVEPAGVDIERFYRRNEKAGPLLDLIADMFLERYLPADAEEAVPYIPLDPFAVCVCQVLRDGVKDAGEVGGTVHPAVETMVLDFARSFRGSSHAFAAHQLLGIRNMLETEGLLQSRTGGGRSREL